MGDAPELHYGGEHHRLSIVDRLGERVAQELEDLGDHRDPEFIGRLLPVLDVALRWFDPVVEGFEHLPEHGPFLIVGNHSGGAYMPDYWAFLREWARQRGVDAPLYSLAFDFVFSIPGFGAVARRVGSVPARASTASRLLDDGHPVMVYPGGEEEDYRPWSERNHIDLQHRTGFVELALRHGVPVVPLVAHGSHHAIFVVSRGDDIAKALGMDRLRIRIMPIVAGPPWGVAPVVLPTWPLPAKVTARVCEPIDWRHLGPDAADDPAALQACYDEVATAMQGELDAMVATLPHPVVHRVGTALGVDRAAALARQAMRWRAE